MFPENTCIALIDFDNFYQNHDIRGLIHDFNRIVSEALDIDPLTENIIIRLYGGWRENGVLTQLACLIQQEISLSRFFPIIHPNKKGFIHGTISLATSLLSLPLFIWDDTVKKSNGLPRLRTDSNVISTVCDSHKDLCPIKILTKFSKKKGKLCSVNDCTMTNDAAFVVIEQKMVDTMISCDILCISEQQNISSLFIMTSDFDFHPAIALASQKLQKRILLIHNNINQVKLMQSLSSFNIIINNWRA